MLKLILRLTPTRLISRLTGILARIPLPHPLRRLVLGSFCRLYGIAPEEAERPMTTYTSLSVFFVRRLRPGLRPISTKKNALISPVDGRIVSHGPVAEANQLEVKGARFTPAELLGDHELAHEFAGGTQITLYLCPGDYHRIHAPASGEITSWQRLHGRILPVNPPSLKAWPRLFTGNERVTSFWLDQARNRSFSMVMVGALNVGSIHLLWDPANKGCDQKHCLDRRFAMGEEVARFNLGSTVILLFPPDTVVLDQVQPGKHFKMGEPLGSWQTQAPGQ